MCLGRGAGDLGGDLLGPGNAEAGRERVNSWSMAWLRYTGSWMRRRTTGGVPRVGGPRKDAPLPAGRCRCKACPALDERPCSGHRPGQGLLRVRGRRLQERASGTFRSVFRPGGEIVLWAGSGCGRGGQAGRGASAPGCAVRDVGTLVTEILRRQVHRDEAAKTWPGEAARGPARRSRVGDGRGSGRLLPVVATGPGGDRHRTEPRLGRHTPKGRGVTCSSAVSGVRASPYAYGTGEWWSGLLRPDVGRCPPQCSRRGIRVGRRGGVCTGRGRGEVGKHPLQGGKRRSLRWRPIRSARRRVNANATLGPPCSGRHRSPSARRRRDRARSHPGANPRRGGRRACASALARRARCPPPTWPSTFRSTQ